MLKIGVIGAGHLGKIHMKCIMDIPELELVGFYDPDEKNAEKVRHDYSVRKYATAAGLMEVVDAVDIVSPTSTHYGTAALALQMRKHIFIEKPLVSSIEEAKLLKMLAAESGVKVQVGHVERYNPALKAAFSYIQQPEYIEIQRLAEFKQRGADVPVVVDLMIHDIDIVLYLSGSTVRKITANGMKLVSDSVDFANALIEFENGCVANLTASRIASSATRKARFLMKDKYVSVDLLNKKANLININGFNIPMREGFTHHHLNRVEIPITSNNAIRDELSDFAQAIIKNTSPTVSMTDGYLALEIALWILDEINGKN